MDALGWGLIMLGWKKGPLKELEKKMLLLPPVLGRGLELLIKQSNDIINSNFCRAS